MTSVKNDYERNESELFTMNIGKLKELLEFENLKSFLNLPILPSLFLKFQIKIVVTTQNLG